MSTSERVSKTTTNVQDESAETVPKTEETPLTPMKPSLRIKTEDDVKVTCNGNSDVCKKVHTNNADSNPASPQSRVKHNVDKTLSLWLPSWVLTTPTLSAQASPSRDSPSLTSSLRASPSPAQSVMAPSLPFPSSSPASFSPASSLRALPITSDSKHDISTVSDHLPLEDITAPEKMDILCGRGKGPQNHPGNVFFREKIVAPQRLAYARCYGMAAKRSLIGAIIQDVRARGSRFLQVDPMTGRWSDIGDRKAHLKTAQALRECTPYKRKLDEIVDNARRHMNSNVKDMQADGEMGFGVDADRSSLTRNFSGILNGDPESHSSTPTKPTRGNSSDKRLETSPKKQDESSRMLNGNLSEEQTSELQVVPKANRPENSLTREPIVARRSSATAATGERQLGKSGEDAARDSEEKGAVIAAVVKEEGDGTPSVKTPSEQSRGTPPKKKTTPAFRSLKEILEMISEAGETVDSADIREQIAASLLRGPQSKITPPTAEAQGKSSTTQKRKRKATRASPEVLTRMEIVHEEHSQPSREKKMRNEDDCISSTAETGALSSNVSVITDEEMTMASTGEESSSGGPYGCEQNDRLLSPATPLMTPPSCKPRNYVRTVSSDQSACADSIVGRNLDKFVRHMHEGRQIKQKESSHALSKTHAANSVAHEERLCRFYEVEGDDLSVASSFSAISMAGQADTNIELTDELLEEDGPISTLLVENHLKSFQMELLIECEEAPVEAAV